MHLCVAITETHLAANYIKHFSPFCMQWGKDSSWIPSAHLQNRSALPLETEQLPCALNTLFPLANTIHNKAKNWKEERKGAQWRPQSHHSNTIFCFRLPQ